MTALSQVPRELAERLMYEIACGCLEPECIDDEEKLLKAEAVIREAMQRCLREAQELADKRWDVAALGQTLHNTPKQYVAGLQDASKQISLAIQEAASSLTEHETTR